MTNMIKNQEIIIMELEQLKNKTIEELEDQRSLVNFKTDQLNEWKQKYEVIITFISISLKVLFVLQCIKIFYLIIMWQFYFKALQEECEMLRLEVNSMNNLNNYNKRGNSLFAEVDDKRQALTAELESKREKYETLKKYLSKANHDNNQMKVVQIFKYFLDMR